MKKQDQKWQGHSKLMGWLNVVLKDVREHSLSLLGLASGLIAVVLLSLGQHLSLIHI